jgi:hypothetical protein
LDPRSILEIYLDDRRRFRTDVLQANGAPAAILDELLAYTDKPFPAERAAEPPSFPLADEAHVDAWAGYVREADGVGVFEALRRHFVQLRCPIRAGVSQEEAYKAATRRGMAAAADESYGGAALPIERPDRLELAVVPTMAGALPILVAGDRRDFVSLVRAFTERNEPAPVSDAMGACIVTGLNNWSRIDDYRARWTSALGRPPADGEWAAEFQRLVPRKELYQDRFIILSRGPYSAIAARDAGFDEGEWFDRSLTIRREHELTHYFTYRVFGSMRNNVFDELIADFVGLVRTFGAYRADLALRFLGLEAHPAFRAGGRLEVYRGQPPLSDEAFAAVRTLAVKSAHNLETFAARRPELLQDLGALGRLTFALTTLTLEELAADEMAGLVPAGA